MRIVACAVVVFLLMLSAPGAAGLGDELGSLGGHDFSKTLSVAEGSRAELRVQLAGALAPEVEPRDEAELERAVRAQPDNWELHVELIEASAAANHLLERQRWYEEWLRGERDHTPARPKRQAMLHAALGTVHWRAGELREARVEYSQAVRLDPDNHAYTEALRTLEAQTGWQRRDTLLFLLFVLFIVAYVALRRRRWSKALRG